MKPEISAPSSQPLFAPHPFDEAEEDVLHETIEQYSHRFVWLSAIILLLGAVVYYLYNDKVGAPLERLEGDVQTQVLTQPATAEDVAKAPVDEAPSQVNEAVRQIAVPAMPWSEAAEAPTALTATDLAGTNRVHCPSGTSRMIYIGEQALCCQGDVCTEAN